MHALKNHKLSSKTETENITCRTHILWNTDATVQLRWRAIEEQLVTTKD